MIGPHVDTGPRLASDRDRTKPNVPETAHAQLGQPTSCGEAAGHVDAGVDDARAARERVDGEAQLGRLLDAAIRQRPRAMVHPEIGRHVIYARRLILTFNDGSSLPFRRTFDMLAILG